MNRHKKVLLPIIIFSVSLTLCFFVIEGAIRLLQLAPPLVTQYVSSVPDPYLPYKPKPLSTVSARSPNDEFDFIYQHNTFGFRDVEHTHNKDAGVFRILGLGDSFTYGAGVAFEKTYLHLLEKMLNARQDSHPRTEIVKAGIYRYFPEPERILLENYGSDYMPDLVLVGFLPNDIIDTYFGAGAVVVDESGYLKTREAKEIGKIGTLLYENSHIFRLVLKNYINYQISKKYQPNFSDVYKDNGVHEKDWQTLEDEYKNIVSIARDINSRVVIVGIPQKGPWNESHYYPAKRLARWARENGAGFVDVLPSMIEASASKSMYYETDGHCTEDGYEVIANVIFQYLEENSLVP